MCEIFFSSTQTLGDIVSAMNDYQSALKQDPSYALAYYNAANIYFLHKQYSQVSFKKS